MDNSVRKAKESIFRKEYEQLMLEAEKESKRREDERRHELLSENPLDQNYARWATDEEFKSTLMPLIIEQNGYSESGIPLVCDNGITYVDPTDSHSLIIGSSGSKKTRLFMMPSIFTLSKAGESMVITDPKAELFEKTSGYLKDSGYKVYCINFRDDSRQNNWNPLEIPRQFFSMGKFDVAVGLLSDFAYNSIQRDIEDRDPFWSDSARNVFMGLLLVLVLLAENPEEINLKSFLRLRNTIFSQKNSHENFVKVMGLMEADCLAKFYLSGLFIAPEKTFGSILSVLDTHLMKFIIRPEITEMLCHNDINFSTLGDEKTAIFLVMPDEKETYHGLISIFIQQCYEALIFEAQRQENKMLKRRVNFLLDEFSSLPHIKEFPSMIAAARSRNIRFNIVVQSEKQLYSRYSNDAEVIEGNCNNWIFLYSKEINTLEKISTLCGTQKSGKPLITLSRLQRLDKELGEALVFHGRQYPYISHLDDIDSYRINESLSSAYEKPHGKDVKIFHLEKVLERQPEEFLRAKLSSTGFEDEKAYAISHSYHAWNFLDTILHQESSITQNSFYSVIKKSIRNDISIHMHLGNTFNVFLNNKGEKNLIKEHVPLSALYSMPDFVSQNIFIAQQDNIDIFQIVADKVLKTGLCMPIIFDAKKFSATWDSSVSKRKDGLILLTIMIANEMMIADSLGNHMTEDGKIDFSLEEYAKCLDAEFHKTCSTKPEFLIMVSNLDQAENVADAIWQAWEIGSYSNVQLIVTASDKNIVDKNCLEYRSSDETASFASPMILYFDENSESIYAKQKDAPSIIIHME